MIDRLAARTSRGSSAGAYFSKGKRFVSLIFRFRLRRLSFELPAPVAVFLAFFFLLKPIEKALGPVTQNIICALSANMVSLSYIFSVDYSGWGATIEQGNE